MQHASDCKQRGGTEPSRSAADSGHKGLRTLTTLTCASIGCSAAVQLAGGPLQRAAGLLPAAHLRPPTARAPTTGGRPALTAKLQLPDERRTPGERRPGAATLKPQRCGARAARACRPTAPGLGGLLVAVDSSWAAAGIAGSSPAAALPVAPAAQDSPSLSPGSASQATAAATRRSGACFGALHFHRRRPGAVRPHPAPQRARHHPAVLQASARRVARTQPHPAAAAAATGGERMQP